LTETISRLDCIKEGKPLTQNMPKLISGAEIVFKALEDQNVEFIFGYPGGAVLPIYDELQNHKSIKHILARHEQGAGHAAEGYARSSGKPGVLLVTSGPGATNAVTALTDAYMDSVPVVCISGQVPTHLIGTDAFQECDTTGITRPCTKHNWLVKDVNDLAGIMHKAFEIATTGRPGPVLIDIPKDIQFNKGIYKFKKTKSLKKLNGPKSSTINPKDIDKFVEMINNSSKPIFYTGGGVINSGPKASKLLRELVSLTGFPITSTLQGLGSYPGDDPQFLGMLGMHGTYEANNAMHDCDLMINIGARFDDRITGKIDEFSPKSKKIHVDIDPSSIGKNVDVDLAITSDVSNLLDKLITRFKMKNKNFINSNKQKISKWWTQIEKWREKKSLNFINSTKTIKPQHAVQRLYELTKDQDTFITTEVGQHQMWAAQHYKFNKPNRWMTSGGLGTMGYGLPAAIGVQIAHPKKLVVDIAGEASILMNMQEMSTAVQYRLPIKIFILNNEYMGMVRQWQELLHDKNYSESYTEALPDFVKLAEAYGAIGIRAKTPDELDKKIKEMINSDRPVIFDCVVDKQENCYPMIPSGKPHNQMLLGPEDEKDVSDEGKTLV
jgi:acetolactate synthase I/II/III large subunit